MPNYLLERFYRLLRHLKNGTLLERLCFGCEARKKERGLKRWRKVVEPFGYVDFPIAPEAMLRLYGDSKLAELIYLYDFEIQERLFVQRYLLAGDVFVDIGANIGLFTIVAAKRVGSAGRVFAFEPNPTAFDRLQENISLNHLINVNALQMAISNETGMANLIVSKDGLDAWSSFGQPIAGESFKSVEVPVTTLAEFVKGKGLNRQVTMIKIDVEGWETAVLRGGNDYLSSVDAPLLQVEFSRLAALHASSSCSQLFQMLCDLGYVVCSYDHFNNRLDIVEHNLDWECKNLFATKDIKATNRRLKTGL